MFGLESIPDIDVNTPIPQYIDSLLNNSDFLASRDKLLHYIGEELPEATSLDRLYPEKSWFTNGRQHVDNFTNLEHADIHMQRVHAWTILMLRGEQHKVPSVAIDPLPLEYAAVTHDLARNGDLRDPFHGVRAAKRVRALFAGRLTPEQIALIDFLVSWHDVDNADISPEFFEIPEMCIFNDADTIEYARSTTEMIDPNYFKLNETKDFVPVARAFILVSERLYKASQTDEERRLSVSQAGRALGILR